LVRKNAEVREWVGLFSANGIPVQSNLTTNLLQTSQKRLLADLLRITILPKSPSDALIELLRIGFFEVPRVDLYRITRALEGVNYSLPRKIELFEFMLDDMLLEGVVGENLSKWTSVRAQILALRSIAQSDLITFLRALVAQSGITDFVRSLSGLSGLESLYDLLAHIEM
jgi:superfamily I DNA/RNA helicase